MTPATTNMPYWFETIPTALKAKLDRINKNFRFVTPVAKEDRTEAQLVYGNVDYYVGNRLPAETAKELATAADPKCYKCLGTGLKDWRAQGIKARVCACAKPFLTDKTTV
jgi:hypothetical protein